MFKASVANVMKALMEMMPWGWNPITYVFSGSSSAVFTRAIGQYSAHFLHTHSLHVHKDTE